MKKYLIWVGIVIVMVLAIALIVTQTKIKPGEIKIGAILPLTGDAALAGINTREGIDLAVDEINSGGGIEGRKIKVIYEDTQADPKTAVSAVNKLIEIDKVPYIIDDSISSVTFAVAPICEKNKTSLLATGATAPQISKAGDYIFRIWNSDADEGEKIALYAHNILKLKKIGILFTNNDYGRGLKEVFQSATTKMGIDLTDIESFEQGDQQYRTQLIKMISTQPEAIYLIGYSKDCIKIVQQAKELKYRGLWLGTTVMLDPTVIDVFKKTGFELYYPIPKSPDPSESNVKLFHDSFFAKYHREPPALSDVGYDAVKLLKLAVDYQKDFRGENIKEGLMEIPEYSGASGIIKFDENGDVHKPIDIVKIK